jgi:hypothetical protein
MFDGACKCWKRYRQQERKLVRNMALLKECRHSIPSLSINMTLPKECLQGGSQLNARTNYR